MILASSAGLCSKGFFEVDQDDLEQSKRIFLISGISESQFDTLKAKNKGVLTLCFGRQANDRESSALVVERWVDEKVRAHMIHYSKEEDCSGWGGMEKVILESHTNTIKNCLGGWYVSSLNEDKSRALSVYKKYASWFLSDDHLLEGLKMVEKDQGKTNLPGIWSPNDVKYVTRVMGASGMRNLDFGFWSTSTNNLKTLVRDYIQPQPDVIHN